jgi:O-antigen ligase
LAFLAALPIAIAVSWRETKRLLYAVLQTLLAGVVVYILLLGLYHQVAPAAPSLPSPTDRLTINRLELWSKAWSDFKSAPWLGIGPYQFAAWPNKFGAHPHSWLLQLLAEWGILATLCILFAAIRLFLQTRRCIREAENPKIRQAALVTLIAVVAALANGLVDGNLVMPVSQSFTAIVLGAMISMTSQDLSRPGKPLSSFFSRVAVSVAGIACLVIIVSFAVKSFAQQENGIQEFRKSFADTDLRPRFWTQGFLVFPSK